jgi:hypothetical protein
MKHLCAEAFLVLSLEHTFQDPVSDRLCYFVEHSPPPKNDLQHVIHGANPLFSVMKASLVALVVKTRDRACLLLPHLEKFQSSALSTDGPYSELEKYASYGPYINVPSRAFVDMISVMGQKLRRPVHGCAQIVRTRNHFASRRVFFDAAQTKITNFEAITVRSVVENENVTGFQILMDTTDDVTGSFFVQSVKHLQADKQFNEAEPQPNKLISFIRYVVPSEKVD